MKKLLLWLVCGLGALSAASGQNVVEKPFSNEIKGVAFDSMAVLHSEVGGDGVQVILYLSRMGAVRNKMGALRSGGGEAQRIGAVGYLKFDNQLNKISEELTFLAIEGELLKYEILAEPSNFLKDEVVLADQESAMKWSQIEAKYPALAKSEASVGAGLHYVAYYENALDYGGGQLRSFQGKKLTLKEVDKKDGLGKLFLTAVSPYEKTETTVDLSKTYHGDDGKSAWSEALSPVSDKARGYVFATHGRKVKGDKTKKDNEYFEQEIATFTTTGTVANRIAINNDKPWEFSRIDPLYKAADKPFTPESVAGVVVVQEESTKKINTAPDPLARRVFWVDEQGQLRYRADFAVDEERTSLYRPIPFGQDLVYMSWAPRSGTAAFYRVNEKGLQSKQLIAKDHALTKRFDYLRSNSSFVNSEYRKEQLAGNDLLIIDRIHSAPVRMLGVESKSHYGFVFNLFNQQGDYKSTQFLTRGDDKNKDVEPGLWPVQQNSERLAYLYTDALLPQKTSDGKTISDWKAQVVVLNRQNLEMTSIDTGDGLLLSPTSYFVDKQKGEVYLLLKKKNGKEFTITKVAI